MLTQNMNRLVIKHIILPYKSILRLYDMINSTLTYYYVIYYTEDITTRLHNQLISKDEMQKYNDLIQ